MENIQLSKNFFLSEFTASQLAARNNIDNIPSKSAIFELNNLGSPRSAADKKIKTAIIQKIFKTTSKTEIEKMLSQELNFRRQELEELFNEMKDIQPDDLLEFINNNSKTSVDLLSKAS